MLTHQQLQSLKRELVHQKEQVNEHLHQDAESMKNTNERDSVGELSLYDNHPADMATELFDREKDFALNEHAESDLTKIHSALQAMDNGSYGKCQTCHEDIPYERLEVLPTTLYCKEHSKEQTKLDDRPVEEQVLEPPHGNSFIKRRQNETLDYQDSFQEVAQFGTSETPSDFKGDLEGYDEIYQESNSDLEGFTETYESFSATDISGETRSVYPSKKHDEYEQMLDDEQLESPLGDIPYKHGDSYLDKDK
ncbi:TraR/DksA C4-type zinc finger protein [Bacillus sp. 2205SS5-2]|uniref:TraR/DksA C4-type zinc finger protein n=1 Tax=Bacillus sp. 2205SS5-2 TaxID=3109031 RepID=UPI003007CB92